MLGFNLTAQEIVGGLMVAAMAGVFIETTVRGLKADKQKQQVTRPQKNKTAKADHSANKPA